MELLEIFPRFSTVQGVSRYFIDLGDQGRLEYYVAQACFFFFLLFLTIYVSAKDRPAIATVSRENFIKRVIISDWTFLMLALGFIWISRIPLSIYGIQNPDESLWIANAKTLLHDPRFWVSVDGGTGGPVVPFTLLILKIFALPIDQGSLKIMSTLLMTLSVCLLFLTCVKIIGTRLSRILILPLVVAISFMKNNDMIAYNSEHPVILLLSLSLLLLSCLYCLNGVRGLVLYLIALGLVLGLVPFTKLQGVPIALFIGLTSCIFVYSKFQTKHVAILVASSLFPALLILFSVWLYGGIFDFWMSYIQNNIFYASQTGESFSLSGRIVMLINMIFFPGELHFFYYFQFIVIFFGLILGLLNRKKISTSDQFKILFATFFLVVSIYSTIAPGRPFIHYTLFLIIPLTLLSAILAFVIVKVIQKSSISWFQNPYVGLGNVVLFVLSSSLCYFLLEFSFNPDYLGKANERYDGYCLQGDVVAILNTYYTDGERMALWGWGTELYEGTDFLMGTRDSATPFQIQEGPTQSYFMKRYLFDLKRNHPKLFVETISPEFFGFPDRAKQGFENFEMLKEYIQENYVLDAEIGGARIYVRKDAYPIVNSNAKYDTVNYDSLPSDFHSDLQVFKKNGSFIKFQGWVVAGNSSDHQQIFLVLRHDGDVIVAKAFQTANKSIVDFSPNNKNNLMCGFLGFIPLEKLSSNDYDIGIYVKNDDKKGFKKMSSFNMASILNE